MLLSPRGSALERADHESARIGAVCNFVAFAYDASYLDHKNLSIHYITNILCRPSKFNFNDLVVSSIMASYEGREEKRLVMFCNPSTWFVDEFSKKIPTHRGKDGVNSTVRCSSF